MSPKEIFIKSLTRVLAIVAACYPIGFVSAATLSPPTVDAPLYSCTTTVSVSGFVPGATIKILVGGTTRIGGGASDSPWGQVFAVSPPLAAGQAVTATQTFGTDTSGPSQAQTVLSYAEMHENKLPTPVVSAPLYECGGALGVTNLAKGGLLRVFADGSQLAQVDGCGDSQWLRVTPLLANRQKVTADEKLCSGTSSMSGAVFVGPAPATLPVLPPIVDIYDGGKYCVIDGISNGALVTTYNGGSVVDKGYYPGGKQVVRLTPPPKGGDKITATQALCSTVSAASPGTVVQPCSSLPPPVLSPICPGDTKVGIARAVIDARIKVYTDGGVLVADGGGPVVNLFGPAKAGQNYTAVQSLGSCDSKLSSPLAVGCIPPQQIPVGIGPGGRAVAIGVDPADSNNIMVASATGGLFRTSDRGVHWSHVSGATTFLFTDVTYVPESPNVIISTADQDKRMVSGGGIWRSTDGGTNWVKPNLTYPSEDCRVNAAAYGLAVEKETKRVWAGTRCGLAYSDDTGVTWTYLSPVTGYNYDTTYAVLSPDKQRVVILTPSGVKVSQDGGASFTQSITGLPGGILGDGKHNQIAVPPDNTDHIYWAFYYLLLEKWHVALYRSTDFGTTWQKVIDDEIKLNRPPFVRIADSLSDESGKYDVYFGDGSCRPSRLQRATAETGAAAGVSSWTALNTDHCDPADLAFNTDGRMPLLLASDGGLHLTNDSGNNWALAGSGPYGYNALQIYEVVGQFQESGSKVDLYFGTQDNSFWASPDTGTTWPGKLDGEGFFLNIPRAYYPGGVTKFTGANVACGGPCQFFISDRLLANVQNFPSAPNNNNAPRLLKPGYYIQNTMDPANPGSTFALTRDTGVSWNARYFFSEQPVDFSQISGPTDDPVVYTPKKSPGTTPNNQEIWQLKRIQDVLATGTPIVSDVVGVKSMGVFATDFEFYKVFGVDPNNPNYLMIPDIVGHVVKVTTDAGGSWTDDNLLTSAVTGGEFKFDWGPSVQVSTVGVDPDCKEHILVGTQQAGIFTTYNSGATWGRVAGSEVIPYVSRFFFKGGGEVIASSYGRGLWKLKYNCPTRLVSLPRPPIRSHEPVLFSRGAKIPLSQITPQRSCANCTFVLARNGSIIDYSLDTRTREVRSVAIDRGSVDAYTPSGIELKLPFRVTTGQKRGGFSGDRELTRLLSDKVHVKGLFVEGKVLRGVVLSSEDVNVSQLPQVKPPAPRITAVRGDRIEADSEPIPISGQGFDRRYPLEVLLDETPLDVEKAISWSSNEAFVISIPPTLRIGGHTVVVRQRTDEGVIEDATTFLITLSDPMETK